MSFKVYWEKTHDRRKTEFDFRDFMYVWVIHSEGILFIHGEIDSHNLRKIIRKHIERLQDLNMGEKCRWRQKKNIFQNTLRWHIPKSRAWYALILCHSIFDLPLPPSNLPVDNKAWTQMKENKHLSRISCVLFYFRYFSPTSSVVFTHTHNKGN